MTPLKVLVVDDEPLARRRLQLGLAEMGNAVTLVGMANGCAAARKMIVAEAPDIVLLDVRMRDGTGFDVLDVIGEGGVPAVIFVTAFDEYAARAFEVNATDYVLKPVDFARLRAAIERARRDLATRDAGERLAELRRIVETLKNPPEPPKASENEFWIRRGTGGFVRVAAGDIDWAEIEEDYVRLHVGEASYLLRDSIKGLAGRLEPDRFMQVHRSTLVRVDAVVSVAQGMSGLPEVVLRSGRRLKVGRIYAKALRKRFRGAA